MADLLGRPVGLVLCDLNALMVVDLDKLESKPCNAPSTAAACSARCA